MSVERSGRAKREQNFGLSISLPVKVASSEPFKMVKVGLCWDEFRMVKVPDALENQPPPYGER